MDIAFYSFFVFDFDYLTVSDEIEEEDDYINTDECTVDNMPPTSGALWTQLPNLIWLILTETDCVVRQSI